MNGVKVFLLEISACLSSRGFSVKKLSLKCGSYSKNTGQKERTHYAIMRTTYLTWSMAKPLLIVVVKRALSGDA
jgi:hypothetical protein